MNSAMDLDMWLLRGLFLLVWCSAFWCDDCNLTRVYVKSRNFHSRLHWDEVEIPGQDVLYTVKYGVYGEKYPLMTGCQNISEPFCDLSSVMDIRKKYFIKVLADELCLGELIHFVPVKESSLEAPTLATVTTVSSLTITLTTPMGPQNHSIKEISCWERCQNSGISSVDYIVRLTHPESEAGKVFKNTSGTITLSHLDLHTEYCGVALYELTHPSIINRQSENTTFCVTLPAPDKPWIPIFIVSALVAFFLVITLVLILCQQHITRKKNLPKALQSISMTTTPKFNPDPKVEISTVNVYTEPPWNTIKSAPGLPHVQGESKAISNAGYAAQDYHDQDWHCRSYRNEQVAPISDRSAKSCTSYSMVVGVMVPHDQEELSSCANDSGLGESISPGLSSCTEDDLFQVLSNSEPEEGLDMIEPDSTRELLVLPVSRSDDGKLKFSMSALQPVASSETHGSEIMPLVARSTPAGERTLLMTDLVSVDESNWTGDGSSSDYRKTYLPNGVPPSCSELPSTGTVSKILLSDCISNYRENWVPGCLQDPSPNDRNCSVSGNRLHELSDPEEDVDDSPSELEAIFLSGWMVQIQG